MLTLYKRASYGLCVLMVIGGALNPGFSKWHMAIPFIIVLLIQLFHQNRASLWAGGVTLLVLSLTLGYLMRTETTPLLYPAIGKTVTIAGQWEGTGDPLRLLGLAQDDTDNNPRLIAHDFGKGVVLRLFRVSRTHPDFGTVFLLHFHDAEQREFILSHHVLQTHLAHYENCAQQVSTDCVEATILHSTLTAQEARLPYHPIANSLGMLMGWPALFIVPFSILG